MQTVKKKRKETEKEEKKKKQAGKQYSKDGRCVTLTGLESQRSACLVLALQACATKLERKRNVLDTARRTTDGIPLLSFVVLFFSLLIKFVLGDGFMCT